MQPWALDFRRRTYAKEGKLDDDLAVARYLGRQQLAQLRRVLLD